MALDLDSAPEGVASVLGMAGWPERRMHLECLPVSIGRAEDELQRLSGEDAVVAGLWLYCGRFNEAHAVAQELRTAEGSYWHAILHRQEPDDWNACYWLKRVGSHPIHSALSARAAAAGYASEGGWNAEKFVAFCSRARREGGALESLAREVQHIEFELLLDWCIRQGRK
jgi:sirohydrochlorin ferrochelatase